MEVDEKPQRAVLELDSNSVLVVTNAVSQEYKPFPTEHVSFDVVEVPRFRLYESLGRVRAIPEESDLSDEAFMRRHRFPEVLEKRSKRRERERLVHERFKLKGLVDRLRSSDRISELISLATLPAGVDRVKEQERLRLEMLAEHEATLKRYDELLEPRDGAMPSKRSRKPPAIRDVTAAAPAAKRQKNQERLVITISRDEDGLRASRSPPMSRFANRLPKGQVSDKYHWLSEDEAEPETPPRDISESFFESSAMREVAMSPKARHSGRTAYAFGVLAPTKEMGEIRDFDVTGRVLANQLGR